MQQLKVWLYFNVIPVPKPTKLVADKVFDVLFHVKFADCKLDVAPFPIWNWFADDNVSSILCAILIIYQM